jgi:DNA-binding IclR family transcriptional regulator
MAVNPAPAALRAFDILDLLANEPQVALSHAEIARRTAMPRATCHSVLLALVERGFIVRQGEPMRYSLGPGCLRVGDAAAEATPLLALATQAARDLSSRTGLSTAVLTRQAGTLTVATATPSSVPLAAELRRGQRLPYIAPFGAAFAAWDDEHLVEGWLDACVPPLDDAERQRLLHALGHARLRGYSIGLASDETTELIPLLESGDTAPGDRGRRLAEQIAVMAHRDYLAGELHPASPCRVSQWSAPVFDHRRQVACIVMMAGPGQPLSPGSIGELGASVAAAAQLVGVTDSSD